MKIRTQNLVAIIPLFLGLSLISGALMYTVERQELYWGINGQVSALAVTTAEYINGDGYRTIVTQGERAPYSDRFERDLQRVMSRNAPRRVAALTSDGERIVYQLPPGNPPSNSQPLTVEPGLIEAMNENGVFVTDIRMLPHRQAILTAYAPIHNKAGGVSGIIAIDLDARTYLKNRQQVLYEIAAIVAIVLLMGIGVVALLTGMVTHEVTALNYAAVELSQGRLVRQIQAGRIREVGDLSNTFNTMNDVLKDVLDKTKRTLIEAKQFQTRTDLAEMYSELFWPPVLETHGNIQIAARHVGSRPSSAFWGVFKAHGNLCALLGYLKVKDDLTAVLDASAVYSLLQQELSHQSPDAAFARVAGLFDFDVLQCLLWDDDEEHITHWRYNPMLGISTPETRTLETFQPIVLHTFDAPLRKTMEDYAALFGHLTPDELMQDLIIAVPENAEGTILIAGLITPL